MCVCVGVCGCVCVCVCVVHQMFTAVSPFLSSVSGCLLFVCSFSALLSASEKEQPWSHSTVDLLNPWGTTEP